MSRPKKRKRPRRMQSKAERLAAGDVGPLTWAEAKRRRWARRTLMRKQCGVCALCGEQMNLVTEDPREATLDHIVPVSRGGTDAITNLQLACAECNFRKGSRMPDTGVEDTSTEEPSGTPEDTRDRGVG